MNEERPLPLLCVSLLALLLPPASLPCHSKRPADEVRSNMVIVGTHLNNARENLTGSLPNPSCPGQPNRKLRRCTPNITNIVSTLHFLSCKMKNLRHTRSLAFAIINSLQCTCPETSTKDPHVTSRPATRRRRHEHLKKKKKLCRAKAILSAVTECYEMLNTLLMDT